MRVTVASAGAAMARAAMAASARVICAHELLPCPVNYALTILRCPGQLRAQQELRRSGRALLHEEREKAQTKPTKARRCGRRGELIRGVAGRLKVIRRVSSVSLGRRGGLGEFIEHSGEAQQEVGLGRPLNAVAAWRRHSLASALKVSVRIQAPKWRKRSRGQNAPVRHKVRPGGDCGPAWRESYNCRSTESKAAGAQSRVELVERCAGSASLPRSGQD